MPLPLSILIPVHNEQEHLQACLDSIKPRDIEVEVIIVDDRSTDESFEIASRWAAPDGVTAQVLRNPGAGKAAALNHALAQATGDSLILLGGDDLIVSELLRPRADAVKDKRGPAVAMCRFRTFSDVKSWDGILLPRFQGGTQIAGGAISLNRAFADIAFPIPEELPNEDTWLRAVTILLDLTVTPLSGIGLHYRIHAGNDTGLMRPYAQVDADMAARARALELALTRLPMHATAAGSDRLKTLIQAEEARTNARWWRLATMPGLSGPDRATHLGNAGPGAFALKQSLIRAKRWIRRGRDST